MAVNKNVELGINGEKTKVVKTKETMGYYNIQIEGGLISGWYYRLKKSGGD